jgi:hypothetical protein
MIIVASPDGMLESESFIVNQMLASARDFELRHGFCYHARAVLREGTLE